MPISDEGFWRDECRTTFADPIWAVQFDDSAPGTDAFVELRHADPRRVGFARVDGDTGSRRWQIDSPGNSWWTRLVAAAGGIVLLQEYPNPELPQPRGLRAIDAGSGQVRWYQPDGVFRRSDGVHLELDRFDAALERRTEIRYLADGMPSAEPLGEVPPPRTRVPVTYAAGNRAAGDRAAGDRYFPAVAAFVRERTGHEPVGQLTYLEFADRVGISYYFYADDLLENRLLVVSRSTNAVWQSRIATERKLGSTTFIVRDNRLLFVQDHVHLVSYVW